MFLQTGLSMKLESQDADGNSNQLSDKLLLIYIYIYICTIWIRYIKHCCVTQLVYKYQTIKFSIKFKYSAQSFEGLGYILNKMSKSKIYASMHKIIGFITWMSQLKKMYEMKMLHWIVLPLGNTNLRALHQIILTILSSSDKLCQK